MNAKNLPALKIPPDLYKEKKGKYRHRTAVRCIKPRRGKYKPDQGGTNCRCP